MNKYTTEQLKNAVIGFMTTHCAHELAGEAMDLALAELQKRLPESEFVAFCNSID